MNDDEVRETVRNAYARIARQDGACCLPSNPCCESSSTTQNISEKIGYSEQEIKIVPEGANLGLGCGNPLALASLREGETVLDLGSGAGFDCFLAARRVGKDGRVIGVDMTPDMIERARENAKKGGYGNVEFRLGKIENLPVADESIDIIISNCVINLSPNKRKVFDESFRVLKPGGRLMISDIALLKEIPSSIRNSVEAYIGCISGAIMKEEYVLTLRAAGFQEVEVVDETSFATELAAGDSSARAIIEKLNLSHGDVKNIESAVVSMKIQGVKPKESTRD